VSVELIANAITAAVTSGAITAASDTTKKTIADAYSRFMRQRFMRQTGLTLFKSTRPRKSSSSVWPQNSWFFASHEISGFVQ
jgi:hypothetical protein